MFFTAWCVERGGGIPSVQPLEIGAKLYTGFFRGRFWLRPVASTNCFKASNFRALMLLKGRFYFKHLIQLAFLFCRPRPLLL